MGCGSCIPINQGLVQADAMVEALVVFNARSRCNVAARGCLMKVGGHCGHHKDVGV